MKKITITLLMSAVSLSGMKNDHTDRNHHKYIGEHHNIVRSHEVEDLRTLHLSDVHHERQIHNHSIDIESQQTSPEVQAAEISAHSTKKVAIIAGATALASCALTAGVALSIHFSSCK